MHIFDIIEKPLLTEKAETLRTTGVYVFQVHPGANKKMVKEAFLKIFGITPNKVNILRTRPKMKRNKYGTGYTSVKKKAYIYLAKSDKIDIYKSV